jgi:HEAT repeat protein
VTAFLVGTLLANRLYSRLGIATVALALPAMYLLGFGVWIVRFTAVTAIVVRFMQQVTQRGVSNATWSAFFNVVPSSRRGQVLAFMDGVPGQIGTMLSGVLIIVASGLAVQQVYILGLGTAIVCLGVVLLIRRAYAASLVATLREGRGEQVLEGGPGLQALAHDGRIIEELRTATRSTSVAERILAADLLGRMDATDAKDDLRRLCDDPDAGVRRVAIPGLARIGGHSKADLLARAASDEDDYVRAAAVTAFGQQPGLDPGELDAIAALEPDPSAHVRGAVAVVLGDHGQPARAQALVDALIESGRAADRIAGLEAIEQIQDGIDPAAALEHFGDPEPAVRAAALRAAAAHDLGDLGHYVSCFEDPAREVRMTAAMLVRDMRAGGPALIDVLESGSEQAREAALIGLDGHAPFVRARLLAWSEREVARATRLREHARDLRGADETSTAAFLGKVIARREAAIESELLLALSALGAPEASGLIRRCLHAIDPEVRAQAIEALDALGDPGLARGVVRLLDDQPGSGMATSVEVIAAATDLTDDQDAWVRALSLRTLWERLRDDQRSIAARVRDDPDPLIEQVVKIDEGDEAMSPDLQLVSDIDRMLILRRVPIFAALGPEDLQRVAAAAVERVWAEGDTLMREGDVGDELVVIVEGGVRVVHRDANGEHVLRTYAAGDHIGELAVLREAPRAATVIAEAAGVRGLVINGEAIHALLRERPDAAMAMLATLAERISQQS